MAYSYSTNNTPATGSVTKYTFKELLKTAGWTVPSSSDGTTYNSSGDQITSGSSGAGGYANNLAWFRVRMPSKDGVTREFTFQRASGSDANIRMKYSFSAGFTGGSPSATQTPSATDEQIVAGSGTDASPSFVQAFATNGAYKTNIVAGDSDEGFVWCILNVANANLTVSTGTIFLERMLENTYPQADPDPYVMVFGSTNPIAANLSTSSTIIKGWLGKGTSKEGFVSIPPAIPYDGITYVGNVGLNAITGKEDPLPILYARRSALGSPTGMKGIGRMLRWRGYPHGNGSSISIAKTISINSVNDHIVVGDLVAPYGGAVPIT